MIQTISAFFENLMPHMPVLSIMALFMGAFIVALLGERAKRIRTAIVCVSVLGSLFFVLYLIYPVMVQGQVISYWMGGWEPVAGYAIGIGLTVDAVSLFFAIIVTVMASASALFSFRYISRDDSHEKYYTLFLMLCGGVLGFVLTGDLFNMYVMVEIMTFSAVALTAFRNWYHGALEAAFKYLIVSCIGSTCILIGTALLYAQLHTLNIAQIAALLGLRRAFYPVELIAFAFLFVGYAIKAFATPFHPIAADAHATAPSSISVMISGVLTKTGVYGIIRICFFMYKCMYMPSMKTLLTVFGCASMIICVSMALMQHDFKRLLAFHSISQIGYVLTAIGTASALGMSAGLYHALNHSLFKGLLFLCAGCVLYRTGSTNLDRLGGLAKKMPWTCTLFLIAAASISGIPPFNGFASKWYIYQALYQAAVETNNIVYILALVSALIVSVMTLASFVKVAQSVFFGPLPLEYANTREAPRSMRIPMAILAALCILTGMFPAWVDRILLAPATASTFNVGRYIDAAMGQGYAQKIMGFVMPAKDTSYALPGFWSPVSWLALLCVMLAALCIFVLFLRKSPAQAQVAADDKHDVFFAGEKSDFSHVGGGDLFWGMRHNLRGYLDPLSRAHTGIVNDYALWACVAMACVIVYVFTFVGR